MNLLDVKNFTKRRMKMIGTLVDQGRGTAWDTRDALPRFRFLHSHAVLGKNFQIIDWRTLSGVEAVKPGSADEKSFNKK